MTRVRFPVHGMPILIWKGAAPCGYRLLHALGEGEPLAYQEGQIGEGLGVATDCVGSGRALIYRHIRIPLSTSSSSIEENVGRELNWRAIPGSARLTPGAWA